MTLGLPLGLALPATAAPPWATVQREAEAAADPAAGSQPLALTIAGPEDDPELGARLQPAVIEVLRDRGHDVHEGAPNGVFVIIDVDPAARDTFRIEIRLEGDAGTKFFPATRCVRCGSASLVEHVERSLENVLRQLPPPAPAPDATDTDGETDGETESDTESDTETDTGTDDSPQAPLGPRGIAGAALLSGGVAAVATGSALFARNTTPHPSRPNWELRLRPPAIAMMAAGGATAIAGAVLLGLDIAQRKPRRTAAVPLLGPGIAGVTVQGRF